MKRIHYKKLMETNQAENTFEFTLFDTMQRNSMEYAFRGLFTNKISDNITLLIQDCMNGMNCDTKIRKRAFIVLVEGLQNITRHQESNVLKYGGDIPGFFVTQNTGSRYIITTGNSILNENIPALKEKLDNVNSTTDKELKALYRQVLNNNQISNKGGAGLGLIEMARKSGSKLIYDFVKIDDTQSYFFLVSGLTYNDNQIKEARNTLSDIKEVYKISSENNIVSIFNGKINQDSRISLLSIIEEHISELDIQLRKRIYYIMSEMLQNITQHGYSGNNETEGMFYIEDMNNEFKLNTINYIKNENVASTCDFIEKLNNMSQEDLEAYYNSNLVGDNGIGLCDIRMHGSSRINYHVKRIDDNLSILHIQIPV